MLLITQPTAAAATEHPADTAPASRSAEKVPAERRRGLRIRQNRPVKVFEPMTSRYFGGQTADISSTGLRIELPAFMPVTEGTVVNIHVGLSEHGQPLANRRAMMPARIVWVDRTPDPDKKPRLMAGVEFVASIAAHLDAA